MSVARLSIVESAHGLSDADTDVVVVPVTADRVESPRLLELATGLGIDPGQLAGALRPSTTRAGARVVSLAQGERPTEVVCVGMSPDLPLPVAHRRAGIEAAGQLDQPRSVAVYPPGTEAEPESAARLVEGLVVGAPTIFGDPPGIQSPPPASPRPSDQVGRALVVGQAVNWCRRLVDAPSSDLTPARLVEVAAEMARVAGGEAREWSLRELEAERFGGILAVGRGSSNPAAMAELHFGDRSGPALSLIGKGVTCDTGGLQIKTSHHDWLWADMAGAAAVLAASWAAVQLGVQIPLRVLLPCVENMPSPGAYRPGDIITHRNGRTTEIRHTDAEGRLVLADVLTYAAEAEPAAIVDVATLTDDFALGPDLWPVIANDQDLADLVVDAGDASADPGWQLPLWPGYQHATDSRAADRANIGLLGSQGVAGSILGGLFLAPFAGRIPWAHIDIAGTAIKTAAVGHWPRGATGSSTAALIRLIEVFGATA